MFEIIHKNGSGQARNTSSGAKIKVIGVGGGGGNIVSTMIEQGVKFVEFLVANTDMQAIQAHTATTKIQLGADLTKGLGAGANPEIGKESALESYNEIRSHLEGTDMVFITAGMGGGTGTGAAPLIAKAAKEVDVLTIGVVTLPFRFEGKRRREQAYEGIRELQQQVDTLIVIPNEKLISLANENLTLMESFKKVDEILLRAVRSVADLINVHGLINLDFSDICTVMRNRGTAIMGVGEGCGAHRTLEAARSAMASPLLEKVDIQGAKGIILSIMGPADLSLKEVNDAATLITDRTHEDAEIVFGAVIDPEMKEGKVKVTLIATGLVLREESQTVTSLSHSLSKETPGKRPSVEQAMASMSSPSCSPSSPSSSSSPLPYSSSPSYSSSIPSSQGTSSQAVRQASSMDSHTMTDKMKKRGGKVVMEKTMGCMETKRGGGGGDLRGVGVEDIASPSSFRDYHQQHSQHRQTYNNNNPHRPHRGEHQGRPHPESNPAVGEGMGRGMTRPPTEETQKTESPQGLQEGVDRLMKPTGEAPGTFAHRARQLSSALFRSRSSVHGDRSEQGSGHGPGNGHEHGHGPGNGRHGHGHEPRNEHGNEHGNGNRSQKTWDFASQKNLEVPAFIRQPLGDKEEGDC